MGVIISALSFVAVEPWSRVGAATAPRLLEGSEGAAR
jgi:hypothetical protein